jgi:ATP synthase protein I
VKEGRPGDGGRDAGPEGLRGYLRYLHLGTQMALTIGLGVFGGIWLDGKFGTTPVLTVSGSLLGIGLGMGVVILAVGKGRK